jgi:putative transcriptional regulator
VNVEVPSLAGKFLIAMPNLVDPNFWQSVVLLGVHSDSEGAFGLIVNRPLDIDLRDILSELGQQAADHALPEVLAGGPVQPSQGFVVFQRGNHEPGANDITVSESIAVSGNTETLANLALDATPNRYRLMLGYSGWYPGQLEQEIEQNSWLIAPLDSDILFDVPAPDRWAAALRSIGIEPGNLVDAGSTEPS